MAPVPPVTSPSAGRFTLSWQPPAPESLIVYALSRDGRWMLEQGTPPTLKVPRPSDNEPLSLAGVLALWNLHALPHGCHLMADQPAGELGGLRSADNRTRRGSCRVRHTNLSKKEYILEEHRVRMKGDKPASFYVQVASRKNLASLEEYLTDSMALPQDLMPAVVEF